MGLAAYWKLSAKMTSIHYLTISEAGRLLRTGALSPVELTRACLDRIAALNDDLHAFITVTAEQAMDEARQAERDILRGRYRGPLHGIPIAHKDIVSTSGVRTTAHSSLLRDWVPETDATVYARLKQAGAISLGKLSLWEFAIGRPSADAAFPPARNPWNLQYSPGGSSSGSGAAVASGMCLGATGTDTGGSIRHPASVCAIVGMKPTFGRVSVNGVLPLAPSLDHVGPMTRGVRDNALMLQAMAGYDPSDSKSSVLPVPQFDGAMGCSLKGLRVGVPRGFLKTPHEPDCLAAFEEALQVLRMLGAQIEDFDFEFPIAQSSELAHHITMAEAYAYHKENHSKSPGKYDHDLRARIARAKDQARPDLDKALAAQQRLKADYQNLFKGGVDVVASPGRESISETMQTLSAGSTPRISPTRMYNMTGMPAMVVPMGFGVTRMPLGLQLAANYFEESLLYQVAGAYEAATTWTSLHPPIK